MEVAFNLWTFRMLQLFSQLDDSSSRQIVGALDPYRLARTTGTVTRE